MYPMLCVILSHCQPVQGMKLYLRVLEAILRAEFARARADVFTNLLLSGLFHKCLMACAFEVVIAAYRMVHMDLPMPCAFVQFMLNGSALLGSQLHSPLRVCCC